MSGARCVRPCSAVKQELGAVAFSSVLLLLLAFSTAAATTIIIIITITTTTTTAVTTGGTRWCSWLKHCAISRKVGGSIPDGVIRIFHLHNRSGRTMALGLTQPLTEISTRNIS